MKIRFFYTLLSSITILWSITVVRSQEHVAPLPQMYIANSSTPTPPPITLSLPFFDDFSYKGSLPKTSLWTSSHTYINNHFSANPISWGIATLDALNAKGTPYDTTSSTTLLWADTLMSHAIDLSAYQVADNIVLSFYIQEQGLGFSPNSSDSVYVFFKNSNAIWEKKWVSGVTNTLDFRHIRLTVDDARFLHPNFAFMFVNRATKGFNNSQWHLDYVYMNTNRDALNEDIEDITITTTSTSLLQQYHKMPFRHFINNPSAYLADNIQLSVANHTTSSQSIPYEYTIQYQSQNLIQNNGTITIASMDVADIELDNIAANSLSNITGDHITLQGTFQITDAVNTTFNDNNIIEQTYHFGNDFAYDDGTPELSYFLTMHQSYNIPALTAVKYTLEVADTLRGVSIFLPQEVPLPRNKEFGIRIYNDIAIHQGQDELLYEELYMYPTFNDTIYGMVQYKFSQPIAMPAGNFYLAIVQPAGGFSDSLYIGLDISNNSTQERYFNVLGDWETSLLPGSLLFRPIVGSDFSVSTKEINEYNPTAFLYPNPTKGKLSTYHTLPIDHVVVYNASGTQVAYFKTVQEIDLEHLPSGMYLVQLSQNEKKYPVQKIIKE